MKATTTPEFRERLRHLPVDVQAAAKRQFALRVADMQHPSLHFKRMRGIVWSARVTHNYRALARVRDNEVEWFWIGTHAEYDQLLRRL